jgi:hypothetical protein
MDNDYFYIMNISNNLLLFQNISSNLELEIGENTFDLFRKKLIEVIDDLLIHNNDKLTWILYRIDVSEKKLKESLEDKYDQKTAEVIADLIIERETQKINKGIVGNTDAWSFDV